MENQTPFSPPETVEQLNDLLVRAAALEHVLLSAYLFTAYSIKQDVSEGGFSPGRQGQMELGIVQSWSGMITGVAVQEMLHLALASNMSSAIGGNPEFRRAELNFPITPNQMQAYFGYGGSAYLGLWPFSQETIERYTWFEDYSHDGQPFPGTPWDANANNEAFASQGPMLLKGLEDMNISSLVELYMAIALGFAQLSAQGHIFSGDPGKQVTDLEVTGLFNYPPAVGKDENDLIPLLTPVVDLESALIAINIIIVQGEGPEAEWIDFMTRLCSQVGLDYNSFPKIQSPPHHVTFDAILNGGTLNGKEVSGIAQNPNWPNYVRSVVENPLDSSPCHGDPTCESHVNLISNDFTKAASDLLNNLYGTMLDLLVAGFGIAADTTPIEPDQSNADYFKVKTYEKATLIQMSIRSMVYLMSPLANALTQLPLSADPSDPSRAGAGFVYHPRTTPINWESLIQDLTALSHQAQALGQRREALAIEVWVSPPYFDVPPPGHRYPLYSMSKLLVEALAADLLFLADRLSFVEGNAPPKDARGYPYPQHVCYGLNACKGQDITGTAVAAGMGKCATADPHVCSGQNHCASQGGCGFSPGNPGNPALQNHPGRNRVAGQVKQANGYWLDNPHSDSACGSPIMPSIRNTLGYNTPDGGYPAIYDKAQGYVWEFARLLFDEGNRGAAPSDYLERYRAPFETTKKDA